jgi:ribosome-associated protein
MNPTEIVTILNENKARDISVLDIQGNNLADFMIIATATSDVHLRTLSREVAKYGKSLMKQKPNINGPSSSGWVLIDLDEIIVHVMLDEQRNFYALEKLWGEHNQTPTSA